MTLEEALREAHEACPCRCGKDDCGTFEHPCLCQLKHDRGSKKAGDYDGARKCKWPGHAAIDLVAKVAALEQAERMLVLYRDASPNFIRLSSHDPDAAGARAMIAEHICLSHQLGIRHDVVICRLCIEERDRLRREVEEAKK